MKRNIFGKIKQKKIDITLITLFFQCGAVLQTFSRRFENEMTFLFVP